MVINRRLLVADKELFALYRRWLVMNKRLLTISKELVAICNLFALCESGLMQVGIGQK